MHTVAAFFASIIAIVTSVFASPTVAPKAPIDIRAAQPAAAAATQIATTSNPFLDPSAPPGLVPSPSSPPPQTVINQPVIERIIERVVPHGGSNISAEKLTAILKEFGQSIESRIAAVASAPMAFSGPAPTTPISTASFAPSQRIDQLTYTAINTPTITGGAISGASAVGASSGSFDTLSAGTLALSGALTGTDATFSGTLTAGTLNVAGVSSQGALVGPYFTATSTTATSTFAGAVGIGTTTPTSLLEVAGKITLSTAVGNRISRGDDTDSISLLGGTSKTTSGYLQVYGASHASLPGTVELVSKGAGFIRLTNGSTESLRITSSGNVGIGTTTPGALLSANGNILGAGTLALTGTTGTTTIASGQGFTIGGSQFVVQQGSGNVGIGTANPTAPLWVRAATDENLFVYGHANLTSGVSIFSVNDANSATQPMEFSASKFGFFAGLVGLGQASPVSRLDVNGGVTIGSYSGTNAAPSNGVIVSGNVGIGTTTPWGKLSITGSGTGTGLAFAVADSANTPRFVIQDNGNVGIGTTSPLSKLDIAVDNQAGSRNTNTLTFENGYNGSWNTDGTHWFGKLSFYSFDASGVGAGERAAIIAQPASSGGADGNLAFWTSDGSSASAERFRISNTGSIGIGTTTPGALLHIETPGTGDVFKTTRSGTNAYFSIDHVSALTNFDSSDDYTFSFGSTERVRFDSGGNVGIGTTTPGAVLEVASAGSGGPIRISRQNNSSQAAMLSLVPAGTISVSNPSWTAGLASGASYYSIATYDGGGTNHRLVVDTSGNVGIGTTTPGAKLHVWGGNESQSSILLQNTQYSSGALGGLAIGQRSDGGLGIDRYGETSLFDITGTGNVGIGTTTPTAQLSTTGTVRFAGLGSGGANLVTDALGNVTASSDELLKDKQGDFTRGLDAINAISPVLYKWRPETGFDTQSTYAGFFAQNVQAAIPEAVSQDSRGHLTLADRPILAALVNAVKELAQRFSDLAERVTTKELIAVNGDLRRLAAEEICAKDSAGETCITRSQLVALLAAAGQTAGSPSTNAPTADASRAPVLELNGNASSTIEVGDTYNDLGARIIAPESDLNLGIVTVVDGATTTAVSIDTSQPGEHTILYTVTSPTTGLTGSIMRTVTVSPAMQLPSPVVEDNPFTSQPANDNAAPATTTVAIAEAA